MSRGQTANKPRQAATPAKGPVKGQEKRMASKAAVKLKEKAKEAKAEVPEKDKDAPDTPDTPLPLLDNNSASVLITIQNLTVNNPTTDLVAGVPVTLNYARYVNVKNLTINKYFNFFLCGDIPRRFVEYRETFKK